MIGAEYTLATWRKHKPRRRGGKTKRTVRVLARTAHGAYIIEYAHGNSLRFRRTVVPAHHLTIHGGN